MRRWNGLSISGKPSMLQVRSRLHLPTLPHPPHHKEQEQYMLHDGKAHISIQDYAPYRCEWDWKHVIICPLPMGQEIDDAMGEHPNKEGQHRFVEHSRQGKAGTDEDKR